jgi:copper chaperone CopZ
MLMFDNDAAEEPFCVNADTTELEEVCVTPVKLSPRLSTIFCELAPLTGVKLNL